MDDDRLTIVEFVVRSISVSRPLRRPPQANITYCGEYGRGMGIMAREFECFATKEELIEYITSDD